MSLPIRSLGRIRTGVKQRNGSVFLPFSYPAGRVHLSGNAAHVAVWPSGLGERQTRGDATCRLLDETASQAERYLGALGISADSLGRRKRT